MPSFKMKFSGVTILQGVEFSIFPIAFEWALQQCSATALPVIASLYLRKSAMLGHGQQHGNANRKSNALYQWRYLQ